MWGGLNLRGGGGRPSSPCRLKSDARQFLGAEAPKKTVFVKNGPQNTQNSGTKGAGGKVLQTAWKGGRGGWTRGWGGPPL